jgi:putative transposase
VARNHAGDLLDRDRLIKFVIRDRDTKLPASFDEVFASQGIGVIKTPVRSPRAIADADRGVRKSAPIVSTGCSCSADVTSM